MEPDGARTKVGWLLLVGLLILRFPVEICISQILRGMPAAVGLVAYDFFTYLLTATLIWWERDRLPDFHFDLIALAIFSFGKIIQVVMIQFRMMLSGEIGAIYFAVAACESLIGIGLWLALRASSRTQWPKLTRANFGWIAVGAAVGVVMAVAVGMLLSWQDTRSDQAVTASMFVLFPLTQLTNAAIQEEPLFRGFLWGYLRKAGWKESWVWLFQAALFWLAHIYYLGRAPISFWIIVPMGGLILGALVWRSRMLATSMVAHALQNGIGDIVAHCQW
jgi:membrane protease YdiL (CAAX protease family)